MQINKNGKKGKKLKLFILLCFRLAFGIALSPPNKMKEILRIKEMPSLISFIERSDLD